MACDLTPIVYEPTPLDLSFWLHYRYRRHNLQHINKMTIPNIGYKANSIYERDAIFDELEKMGFLVELKEVRGVHLCIAIGSNKEEGDFFRSYPHLRNCSKTYPSPESFLTAAREALKPKDESPNGTTYKERFQKISKIADELADNCNKLEAERKQMREQMANLERSRDRLRLRVAQLEGNAKPKRETPPKIVGRRYRIWKKPAIATHLEIGDVGVCTHTNPHPKDLREPISIVKDGTRQDIDIASLELLPEEPWTAEYNKRDKVWIEAEVYSVTPGRVTVSALGGIGLEAIDPSQIRKA